MYITRFAHKEELGEILASWTKMSIEMNEFDGTPLPTEERIAEVGVFFRQKYEAGELIFRVVVNQSNKIVACAGGLVREDYAWPLSVKPEKIGWVVSVYTDKSHRKQGLARKLVDEVCEWLTTQQVSLLRLWASSEGKATYNHLGFVSSSFMEKYID